MPGEVSSTSDRIGSRLLSTKASPREGRSLRSVERVCIIDMYRGKMGVGVSGMENAHVSITWPPLVFVTLRDWPAWSRWAAKERAGMVGMVVSVNEGEYCDSKLSG